MVIFQGTIRPGTIFCLWDGTRGPTVDYDDSAIGSNGTASTMSAYDMWQIVNLYVPNLHAAGYVVW